MTRTLCRQKFGLVVAVRGPSWQGRRCSDDAFCEGGTEGRCCCCVGLDVARTLVAVSVETAQGDWNESEKSEARVHDEDQVVV